MVLDSHTHAWGRPSRKHPWVNGPLIDVVENFEVGCVYDADDLRSDMQVVGIDQAVVVGYPIYDWRDNWYTVECAKEYDELYGIVMIDPFDDDASHRLRQYMAVDDILGFRLGALCPYDQMWETFDPSVTWLRDTIDETEFWEAAIETDALVQILAHEDQLDQAIELVDTYPQLTYLFDHYGHTDPSLSPAESNFLRFGELAEYDNVAVKLSETPHWSNEEYPYSDMNDHIQWLLDRFGRERVVWGSDYPNVSDVATYEQAYSWISELDILSTTDYEWVTERSLKKLANI